VAGDVLPDGKLAILLAADVDLYRERVELERRLLELLGRPRASVSAKPSPFSIRAIASPMPEEPPVTSAERTRASLAERDGRRGTAAVASSGGEDKSGRLVRPDLRRRSA
jgi:hypothetical protein